MKSNILSILKYTTINNLKLNKYKNKEGRKNLVKISLIYLFIGLAIIGYVLSYCIGMYDFAKTNNIQSYIIPLFFTIVMMLILFRIVRMASDVLFKSQDYDLLMSMPITHKDVFLSKLLYIILMNYIITFIIMIPATVFMMITEKLSVMYLLVSLIFCFVVPVIPIVLGTIISIIIQYISNKSRYSTMLSNVLLIVITLALVALPNMLTSYISSNVNVNDIDIMVKKIFYPIYMIKNGLVTYNIFDILEFVILNIVLLYLYSTISYKLFVIINQKLREKYHAKKYVHRKLKKRTSLFVLYKKEIKKLFGTPIYFLNTCIGLILLMLFAVVSFFTDDATILKTLELEDFNSTLEPLFIGLFAIVVSMSCTTGSSISLEGKNIWICKTMPIKPMEIFFSKILVNLTVTIPTILILGIMLILRFDFTRQGAILLFLFPIFSAIGISLFGLLVNLKFPVFDFEAEVYVVKKSVASMLSIMLPMITSIIAFSIVFILPISYINSYLGITLIVILFDLIMLYILQVWGVKRFNRFDI